MMATREPREDDPLNDATLSHVSLVSAPAPDADRVAVSLGELVGRYQVRRLLGSGGMGQVFLARDVVLGRSVALKLVGPSRAGGLTTDRFLDEARAIARLNHPNIVQLYDFGEHDDRLYLALEYIDGETLRDRLLRSRLAVDEALRLVRAIADGLVHAHAAGVFHCDLKPSNVMVGKDGRVRVVDFGIARTGDSATHQIAGSPDWMAPEQWTGGALTDRVDAWALGLVAAQLLTGAHPLGDSSELRCIAARDPARIATWTPTRADIPPAVTSLIVRSLAHDPAVRPSAAEWARAVSAVIVDGRADAVIEDGPFRGLAPFDEQHARCFFGRELEIDAFIERLRDAPLLPIVGPSGAGKSSFLHAGVIPRLRAREPWTVIALRPGADPVGALARHVLRAIDGRREDAPHAELPHKAQILAFRAELLETPTLLAARLATIARVHGGRVLLAIDQLEEAFTQGASEPDLQQFLAMLQAAVDDPLDPVRVVVTLRDDFVGRLAGLRALFVMRQLGAEDLRRTITGPLARYDYEFDDPQVIDDLLAEVGSGQDANLPLLQFACRTLWEGRDVARRRLLRATYRQMGGLAGALAGHADHALSELTAEEHRAARALLLRLVVGTTRRLVAREALLAGGGAGAASVLDRLLAARLLVQRSPGGGEAATIEIAHESLVRNWAQLARWLDESREERRLLEDLVDAARLWERRGRRAEDTWSEPDLAAARHRAAQLDVALPEPVEAFFAAGDARHAVRRRRRRIRYAIGATAAIAIALPLAVLTARYLSREALIEGNTGTLDLVLLPYDLRAGVPMPSGFPEPGGFAVTLYGASKDLQGPLAPLPDERARVLAGHDVGMLRIQRVLAPGGTVFLRIDRRGRPGERCLPSWLRIQAFPGYRTDAVAAHIVPVPSCQATRANTVEVEAGAFIYGGPGEPRAKHFGEGDYTVPEAVVDLPRFAIDRTEVSNAAYEPYARLAALTGYPAPLYATATADHIHDSDPDRPVSYLDAFEAAAFCAYLGKQLPSDQQWVKAARGGLTVHGKPNPHPRRLYPWGTVWRRECVNIASPDPEDPEDEGPDDAYPWNGPVDSLPCGASPYGVLHMVGNVQEWIATDDQSTRGDAMRLLRGGPADAPKKRELATTVFFNQRNPRTYNYANGLRCVATDLETLP